MWYAVNTNGQPYRVFYIDPSGNTVYVTAYRWDANSNYIIFQSPCNCRIYLRQEPYTLSTLDTRSWYTLTQSDFPPPNPTGTVNLEFFAGSTTWSIGSATWTGTVVSATYMGYTINSITYTPTTGVTVYATGTWDTTVDRFFNYTWTNWVSTTTASVSLRVRFNAPVSSILSYTIYTIWDGTKYNLYLSYYVSGSTSPYRRQIFNSSTISIVDTTNGVVVIYPPTSGTVAAERSTQPSMTNVVSVTARGRGTVTTSTSKTFTKVNNAITASNGNTIYIYDSLTQLAYASLVASSSTYSYYLYTSPAMLRLNGTYSVYEGMVWREITVNASLSYGDAIAPHLYDLYFDGIDDYAKIEPLTVYNWSEITIDEMIYPFHPKANAAYSKFSMIGDYFTDYPATFFDVNNRFDYTYLYAIMSIRTPGGTRKIYGYNVFAWRNTWVHVVRRFTSTREYGVWVNAEKKYFINIPSDEKTVLEWNPDTATYPERYRRFVLGANVVFGEQMKVSYAYLRIFSRALADGEILSAYNNVVSANGLELFIDPTFFNGTHFIDLSGKGHHAVGYNGVARVPANKTWIYVIKSLSNDYSIRAKFIPKNSELIIRTLDGEEVTRMFFGEEARANSAGMIEDIVLPIEPGNYTVTLRVYQPKLKQVNVEFQQLSNPVVVPLANLSLPLASYNPAVYVKELSSWHPAYIVDVNKNEKFLIFIPPNINTLDTLSLDIVWNYPLPYKPPRLDYAYATGIEILSKLPLAGDVEVTAEGKVRLKGTVSFSQLAGHTILMRVGSAFDGYFMNGEYGFISGSAETGAVDEAGNPVYTGSSYIVLYVLPNTLFTGFMELESVLILYNTKATLFSSSTVELPELRQWSIDKVSYTVSGEIVGSWSYRIPIYVTLAELPHLLTETGFVFRFELPVGDWIKSGLLSPALEDLMITDTAMRPCLFYIYRVTSSGKAIVFVRYDNTITSNSIVLYVLLQNKQLWGSGRTFSTLATFDGVNTKDFVDDFGYSVYYTYLSYNAIVATATKNTDIKFGKTWFDFVSINSTYIYEQHGSTVFWNTTYLGFQEDDELLIYISRDTYNDVLVYRNSMPLTSFKLSDFRSEPAYYIGYKDVKFIARFKMLIYGYSVGQIVGGFEKPQQVVKNPYTQQQVQVFDAWSMLWNMAPFILLMVIIALVFRLIGGGGIASRGGSGVRLP